MTRRWTWVAAMVLVVLVGAYLGAARRTAGPPLDPSSTAPDGARAMVALVEELGGHVRVEEAIPGDDADAVLVLEDRLSRPQAERLEAWVRGGGLLVVADPGSLLSPPVGPGLVGEIRGSCADPALAAVEVLDVGVSRALRVPSGSSGCFGADGRHAFAVTSSDGSGTVVALGGPDLFTNELLDEADNAVLVAGLLAGEGREVVFLRPGLPGAGDRGLVDLVGTPVRAALWQLAVAFGIVVAWRARRLGRPVDEPQQVLVDGSELTRAVGRLLQGNRRPDRAAAILRDRARRDLSAPLSLPLDAPVAAVVAAVSDHTTLTGGEVHRAVADPVANDDDLVDVARLLARIREEITHDRPATPVH